MEGGKSNNDASKNKSSCKSGKPPKLHSLEGSFSAGTLKPLRFCITSMENGTPPGLAPKSSSSDFTPGPEICQGQLVTVQRLVADSQREAGERKAGLKAVPDKA